MNQDYIGEVCEFLFTLQNIYIDDYSSTWDVVLNSNVYILSKWKISTL